MKEIIPPKISIKEFRVESLNLGKKILDVSFNYIIRIENLSTSGKFYRRFVLGNNVINFILTVMDDLKKVAGTEIAEIENLEDVKEKIVNSLNRLVLRTNDLKRMKDHEKYMKEYNNINCYKITLS